MFASVASFTSSFFNICILASYRERIAQTPTDEFFTGELSERCQRRSVNPYNTFPNQQPGFRPVIFELRLALANLRYLESPTWVPPLIIQVCKFFALHYLCNCHTVTLGLAVMLQDLLRYTSG